MDSDDTDDLAMTPEEIEGTLELMRRAELVSWVMSRVELWRQWRNGQFAEKWAEYYRLWRGFWSPHDKNRDSERSRLISPALQQAVEMTVAEMEEATFGRGEWIDISDDYEDIFKAQASQYRDRLIGDMEFNEVPSAVSETYLNGALYGNGIGKVMTGRVTVGPLAGKFKVWLEPISPSNFVIDPAARNIDDALGCAHEIAVPRHKVLKKQRSHIYYDTSVGVWSGETELFDSAGKNFTKDASRTETVFITEYHGLVPKRLTKGNYKPYLDSSAQNAKGPDGTSEPESDGDLIEAIVTVGNKGVMLKDVVNPFTNKDRSIIAYQHETVPNMFWGRGVSEKGYNPQKALDAELRARMDALGLLTHPVMGADASRLPRGMDLKIRPGRLFLLNGRPSEILEPITFGNLDPSTFQNTSDLERMVQMGTGAMDSATPLDSARRNETSGGMSQMQSGFIKRAKRTMQNVERQFLSKFVQKALWRYMQFAPDDYPEDFKFVVRSSMGIMAREVEQSMLTQLIQNIPPESQLFPIVIKGIIANGASPNTQELLAAINKMMEPDPSAQKMQEKNQQVEYETKYWEKEKLRAQSVKELSGAELNRATAEHTGVKAELEPQMAKVQALNASTGAIKAHSDHRRAVSDQHHQHFETLLDHHNQAMDRQVEIHKVNQKAQSDKIKAQQPKGSSSK